eukprot:TRINITY_DN1373_c0_g2_i1.p1 TRINITY_DN1373_c0_g2~~TRINITY_DN1373_c0_g2_i1.p1  ORF type:complete len:102 (-),score=6.91 TRINITY_DN1373_c0_g2_i1:280-585(-)
MLDQSGAMVLSIRFEALSLEVINDIGGFSMNTRNGSPSIPPKYISSNDRWLSYDSWERVLIYRLLRFCCPHFSAPFLHMEPFDVAGNEIREKSLEVVEGNR